MLGSDIFAQGISPYSGYGFGDLKNEGFVRNEALAGTGVSMPNSMYINNINPALTSYNNGMTTFEFGADWQSRKIAYANGNINTNGGNISYLALSIPNKQKWVISIGAKPYSHADYVSQRSNVSTHFLDTLTETYTNSIKGGLNKFYLTNGFKISKSLRAGISVGLILGSFDKSKTYSGLAVNSSSVASRSTHRMVDFNIGLAHRIKLNEKYTLNTGISYIFGTSFGFEQSNLVYYGRYFADTISTSNDRKRSIPSTIKLGFSLEKSTNWSSSVEFGATNWSNFV